MPKSLGVVLFPDFELLDVFGPLEMFGLLPDHYVLRLVAEAGPRQRAAQGPVSLIDDLFEEDLHYDILLVPGGRGARREVENPALLAWLRQKAETAELVTSVCTGAALLARAGLLDGKRATSNKAAFAWVQSQGPSVDWQTKARWVEDGKFFTSSGVSAGMDMALAVIARLQGQDQARQVATWAEYDWHQDPDWDPFAEVHGLV